MMDLNDVLLGTIDETLEQEGYRKLVEQPFAVDVVDAAIEAVRDNDQSLQQASRSAVEGKAHKLLKEAMVEWGA